MAKSHNSVSMLIILDGFGVRDALQGNAVALAAMPSWKKLLANYPNTRLNASGQAVGLPEGFMGNSEVGHLTIGAGRVTDSVLKRFHDTIQDKSFFSNKLLIEKFTQLKKNGQVLHLMGLLSAGGVHSHELHLHALIQLASQIGLKKVFIHAFLDGRDVAPKSATTYLEKLESVCKKFSCGKLASLHGRFYAMDRDKNLERTEASFTVLHDHDNKEKPPETWQEVLQKSYAQDITDEFLPPTLLDPASTIKPGNGVVFFNFRPDRAQQLTQRFFDSSANSLDFFITPVRYKNSFTNDILFHQEDIPHTLLDELAAQNKSDNKQVFVIAETEKYAHVTYFFRGMIDQQLPNEKRVLVPSIKTKNYIQQPEMSAAKITEALMQSLQDNPAYFYLVNYANADMVGHSGNLQATIKACEFLDQQLTQLYQEVVEKRGGTLFITADHGNAEEKLDANTGEIKTSHTCNQVPFVIVTKQLAGTHFLARNQGLASITPTILKYLELKIPAAMTQEIIV